MSDDLASWLREQLRLREMSGADFARRVDSTNSRVSKWLRGVDNPRPDTCRRIADALGVAYEDVLRHAGHLPPDETDESELRREAISLVGQIPEDTLPVLIPMLRALARAASPARMVDR